MIAHLHGRRSPSTRPVWSCICAPAVVNLRVGRDRASARRRRGGVLAPPPYV